MTNLMTNQDVIIPANVTSFAEKFNQFSRKTAEAVIGMAEVVISAKQALNKKDFGIFCTQIRFDAQSSSIRKLLQIGKVADVLMSKSEKLPPSWTSLYNLSQLSSEVLEDLIDSDKVFAGMSGYESKKLVFQHQGKDSTQKNCSNSNKKDDLPSQGHDEGYQLVVRFDRTPSKDQVRAIESMIQSATKLVSDCSVVRNATLDEFMSEEVVTQAIAA